MILFIVGNAPFNSCADAQGLSQGQYNRFDAPFQQKVPTGGTKF